MSSLRRRYITLGAVCVFLLGSLAYLRAPQQQSLWSEDSLSYCDRIEASKQHELNAELEASRENDLKAAIPPIPTPPSLPSVPSSPVPPPNPFDSKNYLTPRAPAVAFRGVYEFTGPSRLY